MRAVLICAVVAAAVAILGLPLFAPNAFYVNVANLAIINAVVAISLTLVLGATGQLSLGHAGFFACGAYVSAYLSGAKAVPVLLSIPLGALTTMLLAWIVGRLFLKLSGYYLAVATLGFGMLIGIVLRNETRLSGGPDGLTVAPITVMGWVLRSYESWYWLLLAVLAVVIFLSYNLLRSPAGRALRAILDSEAAATTVGVEVWRYKLHIFVGSATLAGLMGALYAHYVGFLTPDTSSFVRSVQYVMMAALGGIGSISGALVGAIVVTLLPQFLADSAEYETLLFGCVLFATVVLMPKGIVPTLAKAWRSRGTNRT